MLLSLPGMIGDRALRGPAAAACALLVVFGATNGVAETGVGRLQLDPNHTVVAFHLGGRLHEIHGSFQMREGTLEVDPASGVAGGSVVVDATSGESGNASRDGRMASAVLEADRFPEIRFRLARVDGERQPDGTFHATMHGTLALHGTEHALDVAVEGRLLGDALTARGHFTVPYVAWGLADPSILLLTVDKTVDIDVTTAGHVVWTPTMGDHQ